MKSWIKYSTKEFQVFMNRITHRTPDSFVRLFHLYNRWSRRSAILCSNIFCCGIGTYHLGSLELGKSFVECEKYVCVWWKGLGEGVQTMRRLRGERY